MVRKAQEDHLVIGFFGSGEVSSEAVEGHLDDYLATQPDNVTFVVPIVKTMWTDTLAAVVEYAIEHDIPYEAVHDEVSAKARNLSKYLKGATKTDLGARIGQKITNRLLAAGKENPENALLAIAWDDDDKELHDVCAKVTAADIVSPRLGRRRLRRGRLLRRGRREAGGAGGGVQGPAPCQQRHDERGGQRRTRRRRR